MSTAVIEQLTTAVEDQQKMRTQERQKEARRSRKHRQIAEEYVFPFMPRTLTSLFNMTQATFDYGVQLVFDLKKKDPTEQEMERALGTITKVATGLRRARVHITANGEAQVRRGWEPEKQSIAVDVRGILMRPNKPSVAISLTFTGFGKETPNCRLVEKEVIIEAQPRHKELQTVVECASSEPEDATS